MVILNKRRSKGKVREISRPNFLLLTFGKFAKQASSDWGTSDVIIRKTPTYLQR